MSEHAGASHVTLPFLLSTSLGIAHALIATPAYTFSRSCEGWNVCFG